MELVQTSTALARLCADLAQAPWVALDTEFMRERTYYPRLCLVQIAVPDVVACIDVLKIDELQPLVALLADRSVLKVVHAARQDVEACHRMGQVIPGPLFDTQLAASFLGYPDQISYGRLVQDRLGVRLSKAHSRTDWAARPLSQAQLQYAADDDVHLASLYPLLRQQLAEEGRLSWFEEEQAGQDYAAQIENHPQQAWLRLGALHKLDDRRRAVAQALASWRERTAQERDLPRQWVLRDEELMMIARNMPDSVDALAELRGLNAATVQRFAAEVVCVVNGAEHVGALPGPAPPAELAAEQKAVLSLMQTVVKLRAADLRIAPSLLARREDLEGWLRGRADPPFINGWRREVVGQTLMDVREGNMGLVVEQDRLSCRSLQPGDRHGT